MDHYKQQKIWNVPVGKLYKVATLLTNIHNCLHPNMTSRYFDVDPPLLHDYLHE
jgi:hypothetical protein